MGQNSQVTHYTYLPLHHTHHASPGPILLSAPCPIRWTHQRVPLEERCYTYIPLLALFYISFPKGFQATIWLCFIVITFCTDTHEFYCPLEQNEKNNKIHYTMKLMKLSQDRSIGALFLLYSDYLCDLQH